MSPRVPLALIFALAAGAGCGGPAKSHNAAQVKQAFAAEGITLLAWREGSSKESNVTAFQAHDREITVAVTADDATAKRSAGQLAVLAGEREGGNILRVDNVVVAFQPATPIRAKSAARRAVARLAR